MKTTIKVLIAGLAAILLAFGVRYIYLETAKIKVDGTSPTALLEDAMLEARTMFLEKSEDIQLVTALLLPQEGLSLLRGADGTPMLEQDGQAIPYEADQETAERLGRLFGDYDCGGKLHNIAVLPDAVIFYTYYHEGGCAGFLYEREQGTTSYFEYLELVENWQLFYDLPPE